MNSKNILLVEGEADRGFFEALCKMLNLSVIVVKTPKDDGGTHNTKEGVKNHLERIVLPSIPRGLYENIGIIIDADQKENGGGYERTFQRFSTVLQDYTHDSSIKNGLIFTSNDGLPDIGLWIMPNNQDNGMLEDWIKICRHPNENTLFQHAQNSIDAIPNGAKFKDLHRSKAEIATWLAWQKNPDHGLYYAANKELLDTQSPLFQELEQWLKHLFPTASTAPA